MHTGLLKILILTHVIANSGQTWELTVPPSEASKVLPWVHTMNSNAKRNFLGINHNITAEYLQGYLDEFCYKVNRRYFGQDVFDRLISIYLDDTWYGKKKYVNG